MLNSQWSKRVCQDGQAGYIRPPVHRPSSVSVAQARKGHSLATGRVSPHIGRDADVACAHMTTRSGGKGMGRWTKTKTRRLAVKTTQTRSLPEYELIEICACVYPIRMHKKDDCTLNSVRRPHHIINAYEKISMNCDKKKIK